METKLSPNAPQYARDLELRANRAEAMVNGYSLGLADLRRYLHSPKFNRALEDGTLDIDAHRVNVDDVLLRLDETVQRALYLEEGVGR